MEEVREALQLVHSVLSQAADADPRQVLAALVVLRDLREELAAREPDLIASARRQGISWAELAPALGVSSRQAAERRYLRLRDAASSEVTADERVQATRDLRAGDRAVTRWARDNSADLRRLAGQITALPGLTKADEVREALGEDDAAALLPELVKIRADLVLTHPMLAAEITAITEHTDRLRRETHQRRQCSRNPA
jgi:hypothetical protein